MNNISTEEPKDDVKLKARNSISPKKLRLKELNSGSVKSALDFSTISIVQHKDHRVKKRDDSLDTSSMIKPEARGRSTSVPTTQKQEYTTQSSKLPSNSKSKNDSSQIYPSWWPTSTRSTKEAKKKKQEKAISNSKGQVKSKVASKHSNPNYLSSPSVNVQSPDFTPQEVVSPVQKSSKKVPSSSSKQVEPKENKKVVNRNFMENHQERLETDPL